MYTLRTVTESNTQINQLIGDQYILIDRHGNYDEFSDNFRMIFGFNHVADLDDTSNQHTKECHALLKIKGDIIALYTHSTYYIMTESGKTFSNLSYRQPIK